MMESIASAAMSMSAAQLSTSYSMALAKKTMNAQEMAAQQLLEMLPANPGGAPAGLPKGQFIDVYA